jgi:hypothetical protein
MHQGRVRRAPPACRARRRGAQQRKRRCGRRNRWIPDELASPAFAPVELLSTIPVASFDSRFDVWEINVPLSDGCAGPELPEEIML